MKFQTTTAAPELFPAAPKLRDRQHPPSPPPSPSGGRWVQQQQQRRGLRLHVWRSCIHCKPISLCQMVKLSSLGAQKREPDAGIGTHSLFEVALENLHLETFLTKQMIAGLIPIQDSLGFFCGRQPAAAVRAAVPDAASCRSSCQAVHHQSRDHHSFLHSSCSSQPGDSGQFGR